MKRSMLALFLVSSLFLIFHSLEASSDRLKVPFERVSSFKLSAKQAKNVSQANISHLVSIKRGALVAKDGSTLYVAKNRRGGTGILVVSTPRKVSNIIEVELQGFQIIGESTTKMVYCSCGSGIVDSEGDDCVYYATSSGNKCGGACSGENAGETCSRTVLNLETGTISSDL